MDCALNIREILEIMPHRFPFLLVDRVISISNGPEGDSRVGHKIVALKNITFNEPYFTGHFPKLPIMPGVLQIEAMAQAACLAYFRKGDARTDFFIASIQDAKFRRPVVPGDTLMLYAEVMKDRKHMIMVRTEARVEDHVVSEAEILAKISPQQGRGIS